MDSSEYRDANGKSPKKDDKADYTFRNKAESKVSLTSTTPKKRHRFEVEINSSLNSVNQSTSLQNKSISSLRLKQDKDNIKKDGESTSKLTDSKGNKVNKDSSKECYDKIADHDLSDENKLVSKENLKPNDTKQKNSYKDQNTSDNSSKNAENKSNKFMDKVSSRNNDIKSIEKGNNDKQGDNKGLAKSSETKASKNSDLKHTSKSNEIKAQNKNSENDLTKSESRSNNKCSESKSTKGSESKSTSRHERSESKSPKSTDAKAPSSKLNDTRDGSKNADCKSQRMSDSRSSRNSEAKSNSKSADLRSSSKSSESRSSSRNADQRRSRETVLESNSTKNSRTTESRSKSNNYNSLKVSDKSPEKISEAKLSPRSSDSRSPRSLDSKSGSKTSDSKSSSKSIDGKHSDSKYSKNNQQTEVKSSGKSTETKNQTKSLESPSKNPNALEVTELKSKKIEQNAMVVDGKSNSKKSSLSSNKNKSDSDKLKENRLESSLDKNIIVKESPEVKTPPNSPDKSGKFGLRNSNKSTPDNSPVSDKKADSCKILNPLKDLSKTDKSPAKTQSSIEKATSKSPKISREKVAKEPMLKVLETRSQRHYSKDYFLQEAKESAKKAELDSQIDANKKHDKQIVANEHNLKDVSITIVDLKSQKSSKDKVLKNMIETAEANLISSNESAQDTELPEMQKKLNNINKTKDQEQDQSNKESDVSKLQNESENISDESKIGENKSNTLSTPSKNIDVDLIEKYDSIAQNSGSHSDSDIPSEHEPLRESDQSGFMSDKEEPKEPPKKVALKRRKKKRDLRSPIPKLTSKVTPEEEIADNDPLPKKKKKIKRRKTNRTGFPTIRKKKKKLKTDDNLSPNDHSNPSTSYKESTNNNVGEVVFKDMEKCTEESSVGVTTEDNAKLHDKVIPDAKIETLENSTINKPAPRPRGRPKKDGSAPQVINKMDDDGSRGRSPDKGTTKLLRDSLRERKSNRSADNRTDDRSEADDLQCQDSIMEDKTVDHGISSRTRRKRDLSEDSVKLGSEMKRSKRCGEDEVIYTNLYFFSSK